MPEKPSAAWEMDIQKIMADLKMPAIGVDQVMAAQRKNIEALTSANRLAFEGIQAAARRQTEAVREMLEGMSSMLTELVTTSPPEAKMAKEADLAKSVFERALTNMRELSEMLAKSNSEAADVINNRIRESLDEIKTLAEKQQSQGGGQPRQA